MSMEIQPYNDTRTDAGSACEPARGQSGFSLVELMIAMALSLVLLAGVVQIFVTSKQTYRAQEANSRVQESGRIATALLQRGIRPAGFQGCRAIGTITPTVLANPPVPVINAGTVVQGSEGSAGSWTPALPGTLATTAVSGTDAITVQGASNCGANLTGNMATLDANIKVDFPNACGFAANQVLLISDCSSVDIFRATSVSNGAAKQTIAHAAGNTDPKLSKIYDDDSDLLRFSSFTYYIAPGADGLPALWQLDNTSATSATNPTELVSNIADMQIEYGQDADGDQAPDSYVTADTVTTNPTTGTADWAKVISVRVSLLVQTQTDNITTQAQTYTYNRASVTAPDRRIYRVFTTTILLRNKVS